MRPYLLGRPAVLVLVLGFAVFDLLYRLTFRSRLRKDWVGLADPPDLCDHDGKATGTLRLNPLRAEVTCDHCGAIMQLNPPSTAVRFCDVVAMGQAFHRAQAKLDAEPRPRC
jgi:hypothetical protein